MLITRKYRIDEADLDAIALHFGLRDKLKARGFEGVMLLLMEREEARQLYCSHVEQAGTEFIKRCRDLKDQWDGIERRRDERRDLNKGGNIAAETATQGTVAES